MISLKVECDLCGKECSSDDHPPEMHDFPYIDGFHGGYGRFRIKFKLYHKFWHGLPFGYKTERKDVCWLCMTKIITGLDPWEMWRKQRKEMMEEEIRNDQTR